MHVVVIHCICKETFSVIINCLFLYIRLFQNISKIIMSSHKNIRSFRNNPPPPPNINLKCLEGVRMVFWGKQSCIRSQCKLSIGTKWPIIQLSYSLTLINIYNQILKERLFRYINGSNSFTYR